MQGIIILRELLHLTIIVYYTATHPALADGEYHELEVEA